MEKARGIMRFREEAKSGGETRNCRFSEREREREAHPERGCRVVSSRIEGGGGFERGFCRGGWVQLMIFINDLRESTLLPSSISRRYSDVDIMRMI